MVKKKEELRANSWFHRSGEEVRSNRKIINTPELRDQSITVQKQKIIFPLFILISGVNFHAFFNNQCSDVVHTDINL